LNKTNFGGGDRGDRNGRRATERRVPTRERGNKGRSFAERKATFFGAGLTTSLSYTNPAGGGAFTGVSFAPGPNTCQQSAMSCNLCKPSHTVCGPGSSSRFRFT
jgi:hypothetical protein